MSPLPLLTLAAMLAAGSVAAHPADPVPAVTALSPAANAAVAEKIASLLDRRYVFPAKGQSYAARLRTRAAAGAYAGITDRAVLAARLDADLQAMSHDGHLHVGIPQKPLVEGPQGMPAPGEVIRGVRQAKWLKPGIAYIDVTQFDNSPQALAAVDAFLRDHASARALVIDFRDNTGGAFEMMPVLANRLIGTERRLLAMDMSKDVADNFGIGFPHDTPEMRRVPAAPGLIRFEHWAVPAKGAPALFRVPVYLLVSRRTLSAAEHIAMALKVAGRATLIGERTAGLNHFGGTEDIGEGLEIFLPIGRTTDPATGQDWEGKGVTPDVAVPADKALGEALRRIGS